MTVKEKRDIKRKLNVINYAKKTVIKLSTRLTLSSHGIKLGGSSIFCANLCRDKAFHVVTFLPAPYTDAIRQA